MDFLKERIGIEVGFGHASFIGIDLLKFQVSSYSALDKIDVGVYVVTTSKFQKFMKSECGQNWEGSLTFEKVKRYLPHFKKRSSGADLCVGNRCLVGNLRAAWDTEVVLQVVSIHHLQKHPSLLPITAH